MHEVYRFKTPQGMCFKTWRHKRITLQPQFWFATCGFLTDVKSREHIWRETYSSFECVGNHKRSQVDTCSKLSLCVWGRSSSSRQLSAPPSQMYFCYGSGLDQTRLSALAVRTGYTQTHWPIHVWTYGVHSHLSAVDRSSDARWVWVCVSVWVCVCVGGVSVRFDFEDKTVSTSEINLIKSHISKGFLVLDFLSGFLIRHSPKRVTIVIQ